MKQPIIKADWVSGSGTFPVVDIVKVVYEASCGGDLFPVDFLQTDENEVELINPPTGQIYYKYKKPK